MVNFKQKYKADREKERKMQSMTAGSTTALESRERQASGNLEDDAVNLALRFGQRERVPLCGLVVLKSVPSLSRLLKVQEAININRYAA